MHLRCDLTGKLCAEGDYQPRFEELRRRSATCDSYSLEAVRLIDEWPKQFGFDAALGTEGMSSWALVRISLIEKVAEMLRELEIVHALVDRQTGTTLVLRDATPAARTIVQTVGASRGLATSVTDRAIPKIHIRERLALFALLGTRLLLGAARTLSHRLPRSGAILSIDYTTLRCIRHGGRERMMNPYFTPVLDELERRALPEYRINLPTLYNVHQDRLWLAVGDPRAIPFEWRYAQWWLRRQRRKYPQIARARAKLRTALTEQTIFWRGIDIRPLVADVVDEALRTHLPPRLGLVDFFEDLFRRERPSVVLLNSEYSGTMLSACFAARRMGIPTVGVQHGVIWHGHPGYVAPHADQRQLVRPGVLCVFGDFERDLILREGGFAPEQIVVTGAARLDLFAADGSGFSRSDLAAQLNLSADTPFVLFTAGSQPSEFVAATLAEAIAASPTPISVIVKLHPTYPEQRAIFEAAARLAGCSTVRVIGEEFDLYDLLRATDVHMSTNSTVLTEAVLLDKSNIMLCTGTFTDTIDYRGREVAVSVEQYGSLSDAVHAVTVGPDATRLRAARAVFIRSQFHSLDGKASVRIADVVERAMRARDTSTESA